LVTLLCLYASADTDLGDLTADDLKRLAQRSDPGDRYLLTEVRQLTVDNDDKVLRFIDDLVEASYGLPEALTRLEEGPAGRALGRRDLTAEAIALISRIVRAAILHLDPDGVPVAFAGRLPTLALAIASGAPALVSQGGSPEDRALRR